MFLVPQAKAFEPGSKPCSLSGKMTFLCWHRLEMGSSALLPLLYKAKNKNTSSPF
jgi:hypothetical protein